jgi:hypothetical protein
VKTLWEFLAQFWRQLRPWVIVNPWERAIRVRLGRWRLLLGPGLHLKLPIADAIFSQSVRRRICSLRTQTLTTDDGKTATLGACLGYEITNLDRLYDTLHHAEDTLENLALAAFAREVRGRRADACDAAAIEAAVQARLDFARFGVGAVEVYLTDFAFVRTYRLISDPRYSGAGEKLETTAERP